MSATATKGKPMILGMIGVGGFGGYRRQTLRTSGLFKIAACYDRNADTLAKAAAEEGAKACSSVDEVLAFPGLEGLVISTGVDTHSDLTIKGLNAGLHVLVEKPLCGRLEEVEQLLEARRRSGKVVATGHSDHATDWVYKIVRDFTTNGKLGTIACYEENSSHAGGLEIKPGDWRGIRARNPGGMLLQCGVHALHRINHMFGPIKNVQAMFRYDANPNTQTADVASVLLRHDSGMIGTLNCYHVTAYCHEFRLFGSKGNLYLDTHAKKAWYQERANGGAEHKIEVPIPMANDMDWCSNVVNWYKAVRNGGNASPSLEDGINAVLPVFASEISDEQGRRVEISEMLSGVGAHAETLRIGVAQPLVLPGDIDENIRRMEPLVAEAKRRGAEVVLFSETGITGYDWYRRGCSVAVPANSTRLDSVNQMARKHDVVIINGYHEKDGQTVYNSAAVFYPDGKRITQRKHNVQISENDMGPIAKGPRERTPFYVKGFKLAILICADNGIEKIYEELAADGYDAVMAPTAGLGHSKFAFHQRELSDPKRLEEYAKAAESVCYLKGGPDRAVRLNMGMACCNQSGYVEEMQYFHCGHAGVVDRTGETTALIPGRFIAEHLRPDVNVGFITKR